MDDSVPLMRCGIVTSRLFTKRYLLLIFGTDLVMFLLGLFTHFRFEGVTVGIGMVVILFGTNLIGRKTTETLELFEKSFDVRKNNSPVTYSYNTIVGIIKDISEKQIDFRYRIITNTTQYLLDTNQKDLPDSVINKIGFWVYDPKYKDDMVCWKRLATDNIVYKQNPIEVLTWSDRLYFKQFQTAFFATVTILTYFLLTLLKFVKI